MCTRCGIAVDDHPGDGSCPLKPPEITPANVTLWALRNGNPVPVDMPAATSGRYATKRVAEALGLDPNREFRLVEIGTHLPISTDDPVAPYNGHFVHLELGLGPR